MSDVKWGKMLGTAAIVTGAAVAGIGLGGEALAEAMSSETIGTVTNTVTEAGKSAAGAVGLNSMEGGTAAAIAGGTLAAAGVVAVAHGQGKDKEGEEKLKREMENFKSPAELTAEQLKELKEVQRRLRMMQEMGKDMGQGMPPASGSKGPERG